MARSGDDLGRFANRDQVHQTFGEPVAAGVADGFPYEEFHTRRKTAAFLRADLEDAASLATQGLAEIVLCPYEICDNGQRILLGRTVRFQYDSFGQVMNVTSDGALVLPSHGPPGANLSLTPP
jgi:hypothetical protein